LTVHEPTLFAGSHVPIVEFVPDGSRLICVNWQPGDSESARVSVIDTKTFEVEFTCKPGSSTFVGGTNNGGVIVTQHLDHNRGLAVLDLRTGKLLIELPETIAAEEDDIELIDGTKRLARRTGNALQLWDFQTKKLLMTYRASTRKLNAVACSAKTVVVAEGSILRILRLKE
jgi:hypothetical protein